MSIEIVRKLREQRASVLLESQADYEDLRNKLAEDEEDPADYPESQEEIGEENDVSPEEQEVSVSESEEDESPVCECGSSNIVEEDGKSICDDCGREVNQKNKLSEDQQQKSVSKSAVLKKALEWWNAGHYQKAVALYKKYGVQDKEFARALTGNLNQLVEELVDLDADDLEESLELSIATPYVERDGSESMRVIINGQEYRYRSDNMSVSDLIKKFMGIHKHSLGAALQWLKKNSYVYFNGRTKKFNECGSVEYKDKLKENEDLEIMKPEEPSNMDKNIIRAIQKPVSTADKPNLDAAITEAVSSEPAYDEKSLIAYLRSSKDSPIYIRTSKVKAGWDDVQFAASKANYRVSRVYDKSLLNKLNLSGNFAEFYIFNKK